LIDRYRPEDNPMAQPKVAIAWLKKEDWARWQKIDPDLPPLYAVARSGAEPTGRVSPEIRGTSAPSGPPSDHNGYADADEDRDEEESRKIGAGVAPCFAARRLVGEIQFHSNVLTGSQRRSGTSGSDWCSGFVTGL
jgi:hypothetical protein